MITLIFGEQRGIWAAELDWRDIFPARRLSREPVWHETMPAGPPPAPANSRVIQLWPNRITQRRRSQVLEPGGG